MHNVQIPIPIFTIQENKQFYEDYYDFQRCHNEKWQENEREKTVKIIYFYRRFAHS